MTDTCLRQGESFTSKYILSYESLTCITSIKWTPVESGKNLLLLVHYKYREERFVFQIDKKIIHLSTVPYQSTLDFESHKRTDSTQTAIYGHLIGPNLECNFEGNMKMID